MTLTVKICGLSTPGALDAAIGVGADMVGFVFFPPSPRNISIDTARTFSTQVHGRAQKVALTVDADDALLDAIVRALQPDILQFHGKEQPDRIATVKKRFGLPVMKAIAIEERADVATAAVYAPLVDRLLFDARAPRAATRPGGLGKPFDWRLLQGLNPGVPFMLSGGLNAANVAEAMGITSAPGVDVSSGVERAPGEKDIAKIRAFVRAAREGEKRRTAKPAPSPA
ncbi:MAG TPA: phosphoribosylanthranilate isomerase [Xanthobacteraceae bacterium]|jgi:phosphoribosylanthranilate isomerase